MTPDRPARPTPWRPLAALPSDEDRERLETARVEALDRLAVLTRWGTRFPTPADRLAHLTATITALTEPGGVLASLAAARSDAINQMRAAGASWPEIARVAGVTVTRLHQLRRPPATTRTGPHDEGTDS